MAREVYIVETNVGSQMSWTITILFTLLVGFACGYGVRELISRRRYAAAREEYHRRREGRL